MVSMRKRRRKWERKRKNPNSNLSCSQLPNQDTCMRARIQRMTRSSLAGAQRTTLHMSTKISIKLVCFEHAHITVYGYFGIYVVHLSIWQAITVNSPFIGSCSFLKLLYCLSTSTYKDPLPWNIISGFRRG
jgi:hypothetical protein